MTVSKVMTTPLFATARCAKCSVAASVRYAHGSRLPTIARPSFWASLVPRFWRKPVSEEDAAARARARQDAAGAEERRNGLIFLFLGIVVGSNAIHIITLKREMLVFSRQTDARLALLREVIGRVKSGEEFDVRKALGTGEPDSEKQWEEVIRELERADMLQGQLKDRETKRAAKAEERRLREAETGQKNDKSDEASEREETSGPKFIM